MFAEAWGFLGGEGSDEAERPAEEGGVETGFGSGSVGDILPVFVLFGFGGLGEILESDVLEGDGLVRALAESKRGFMGEVASEVGLAGPDSGQTVFGFLAVLRAFLLASEFSL